MTTWVAPSSWRTGAGKALCASACMSGDAEISSSASWCSEPFWFAVCSYFPEWSPNTIASESLGRGSVSGPRSACRSTSPLFAPSPHRCWPFQKEQVTPVTAADQSSLTSWACYYSIDWRLCDSPSEMRSALQYRCHQQWGCLSFIDIILETVWGKQSIALPTIQKSQIAREPSQFFFISISFQYSRAHFFIAPSDLIDYKIVAGRHKSQLILLICYICVLKLVSNNCFLMIYDITGLQFKQKNKTLYVFPVIPCKFLYELIKRQLHLVAISESHKKKIDQPWASNLQVHNFILFASFITNWEVFWG